MASRLTILYYDDTSDTKADHQWKELTNRIENPGFDTNNPIATSNRPFTYGGGSPILDCNINDRFGAQMEMKITLNNSGARHRKNWTGSEDLGKDPLANGQINQFNGLLPEFTRIIVHETDTYMTLFVGRIYISEEKFEFPMGNILRLTCRDNLEEVGQANLGGAEPATMVAGSAGVGNYPSTISRQLDVIKDVVRQTTYGGGTNEQEIAFISHKTDKGASFIQGFTAQDVDDHPQVSFKKFGQTSPLKVIQNLANLEKWKLGNNEYFGFGFFLDATRTVPYYKITSAINGEGILPQDFTYFRKGFYPTASPATYGLNATYAQAASINENPSGSSDDRTRNMFNDFNFSGFADSTVTHVTLVHTGHEELELNDVDSHSNNDNAKDSTWDKITRIEWGASHDGSCGVKLNETLPNQKLTFTILYVDPLDGQSTIGDFTWKTGRPGYTGDKTNFHVRSFRQVSGLFKSNVGNQKNVAQSAFTGVGGTKHWIGNVQFQGIDANDDNFLIISNPQDDILSGLSKGDVLYESSTVTPLSGCKFNYYPAAKRRSKRSITKNALDMGTGSNYGIMRNGLAHEFLGANNKESERMRKGYFRISDWPHMRWTNTAGSGSTGSTLKPFVGTNVLSDFGMRRGNSVTSTDSNGVKYAGYIYDINDSTDSVTVHMFTQSDLDEDSTSSLTQKTWSQNDPYNIYVSLRTGMTIRVDNKLALSVGDHIITSINYSWANGHVSAELTTVGINDETLFQSREDLKIDSAPSVIDAKEPSVIDAMTLAANAYEARGVMWWHDHVYGATPSLVAAGLRDYNSFAWSGGAIKVHATDTTYQINPGNTDAALTYSGYTSPMQANIQYVLYLDRSDPQANARYDIRIAQVTHDDDGYMRVPDFLEMAYMTIGENEDAGSKTIGLPGSSFYSVTIPFPNGMPNIQFMNTWSNVLGLDNQIVQADRILQPNSLTTSLLKKGAGRPWASNLRIQGTAYNAISWDNGSASTDATLTFGNGDTVTIADGIQGAAPNILQDNDTTYMFLDGTSAGLTGTLTPQFSNNHAIAHGDNKLLLAVIAVAESTDGDKPNILPFNSKQMTINGGVIAADAIIADHIQANTVTTIREGVTKANVGLGNVDNNSTSTIRGGVTPIHVSDNMTGVTMNSDGFIYSGSKSTYASDTAGWFIGFDDVASNTSRNAVFNFGTGSNRIRWTGSALQIIGDLTGSTGSFASGAVVIGAGGITFNDANAINGLAFHLHVRNNSTDSYSLGTYSYGTGREAGVLWMRGGGTSSSQAPFIFIGGAGSDYASFRPGSNEWLGTSGQAWGKVFTDSLVLEEQSSSPGDVTNGHGQLYTKSDGNLYYKAGGVSEVNLGAGGGNDYSNVSLVDGLGTTSGVQNNSADQSGDTLGLKAGLGIKLHGSTAGTPEIEIELEGAKANTGQVYYMAYYSANDSIDRTPYIWINTTASPVQLTPVNADFYMNSNRIHALNRGNSFSTCDLNFNADSNTGITGIAGGNFALVTDSFKAIDLKKHPLRATVGISGNSDATYNLTVSGTAYKTGGGTHWNSTSDDRIKTDVSPLTSAVTKLSELKPISYKWSDNWQEATQAENYTMHGFLASEYKTVFPNHTGESSMTLYKVDDKWVSYLDGDIHPDRISERVENIVTINDSVLTPYLIAAIQELKAEIETLKGQIGG